MSKVKKPSIVSEVRNEFHEDLIKEARGVIKSYLQRQLALESTVRQANNEISRYSEWAAKIEEALSSSDYVAVRDFLPSSQPAFLSVCTSGFSPMGSIVTF